MVDYIIVLFEVCLGVYLLYCGITGKGKLYTNENIRRGDERKHRKIIRIMSSILGPVMLCMGLLEYLNSRPDTDWPWLVLPSMWLIVVVIIIIWFILVYRVTDHHRKRTRPKGSTMKAPEGAFDFDEEEVRRPVRPVKHDPKKKK